MPYKRSEKEGKAIARELLDYITNHPGYRNDPENPEDPLNIIIKNHTPDNYNLEEDKDK